MMPGAQRKARTTGSAQWNPDKFFDEWDKIKQLPKHDDLRTSIIKAFNLSERDSYVYHAIASVTLAQVQEGINSGSAHGLHAWYLDNDNNPVEYCQRLPKE